MLESISTSMLKTADSSAVFAGPENAIAFWAIVAPSTARWGLMAAHPRRHPRTVKASGECETNYSTFILR